jgi:hypothetical protein
MSERSDLGILSVAALDARSAPVLLPHRGAFVFFLRQRGVLH